MVAAVLAEAVVPAAADAAAADAAAAALAAVAAATVAATIAALAERCTYHVSVPTGDAKSAYEGSCRGARHRGASLPHFVLVPFR